uniref:UPF0678 fatty acid-binding protein-like protein At1g79260 n=1 Tax=Arabidopsis thaliana TaxID=3702 RepID=UPI000440047F|nr:Chain A, UPF0678 fatty acid-binding protein-like protein At1g79260 [Arabidopsis thaliana]3WJB_B Chain B, UPF0678 fatty acid-binding protein-like protein At1g79260 [Arabidopsis thaliana]3WJC_A Chain A, UPF0678 fatty acid-binding protein-like protein At1g79260 [Arabidopsis thaliana]3WJC_B Chain B, UPF0678 fatty acid-binding protein-like protein At1g79260 [Arabidopsis thaliana]
MWSHPQFEKNQLQQLQNPGESPPVHPFVAPLSYLLGTWRGQGEGEYPTIPSFRYGEEIRFSHSGKPVIAYTQKTWKLESGAPLLAESGYFRPRPDGSIEVVIACSTGLVEVQKGTYNVDEQSIKLKSDLVGNASKVKEISREFELVDGKLSYVVRLSTTTNPLQPLLKAILDKL